MQIRKFFYKDCPKEDALSMIYPSTPEKEKTDVEETSCTTWEELLSSLNIFTSKGQARKSGFQGAFTRGYHYLKVGKENHSVELMIKGPVEFGPCICTWCNHKV